MDKLNYDILDAIYGIDEAVSDSRESVFDRYNDIYEKQNTILENYYDIDFKNQFDIFQEAKTENVNIDGLSAFKFDNTKLLEAIRLMNEAFKDVLKNLKSNSNGRKIEDFRKNLSENNFLDLYKHKKFKEAIKCIEQQFDCKIKTNQFFGLVIGTATIPSITTPFQHNKITVSKTQGFKLGGQVLFMLIGDEPTMYMPKDENLFGQYCCSIYLHEIFHNIYAKVHMSNIKTVATTQMFLDTLKKCCNEQQVVACCEHYTDAMHKQLKMKVSNKNKAVIVKQLSAVCVKKLFKLSNDQKPSFDVDDVEANDINDKDIKEKRKGYNKFRNHLKFKNIGTKIVSLYSIFDSIVSGAHDFISIKHDPRPMGKLKSSFSLSFQVLFTILHAKNFFYGKDAKTKKNSREEHYCDLFSGMYGLPVTFRYFFRKGKVSTTANKLTDDQLKQVYDIERIIEDYDPHPTATCRNYAGYQIAKQFINNKDIAPEIQDYCKWVIDNFSSTEKLDIEHNHNSRIFNPEEAKDIDRHLKNIVLDNQKKITVTEYDMSWIGCIDESEIVFE